MPKKVAVIGAGASGLPAIKCCLDEGLEPICFERTDYIGGLWHFTPEAVEGQSCVMKTTVINTSKEMTSYSDFPAPREFPIFMHNRYVEKYFHLYADKFDLKKHIRFNTEVLNIIKGDNFDKNGQWKITTRNVKTSETEEHVFDGVLVCTGHHANKKMPEFPGMDKFKGRIVHTHDYKDHRGFEDKRIVVVGIGNSGGDVTVELSRVGSQVYLSTRRGAWIFFRLGEHGQPFDVVFNSRYTVFYNQTVPGAMERAKKSLNSRFNHKKFTLEPNYNPSQMHPTVNDELPSRIMSGSVIVKPNIKEVTETGVIFEDGTSAEVDIIVTATGYKFGFPFIDPSVINVKDDNKVSLYKQMYPPDLEKKTLAIIGCFQPVGSLMPLSELQGRIAARVIKGDIQLKSKAEMWAEILQKQDLLAQRYIDSTRHTMQVDFVQFMDELAELNGCKPDLVKLWLTDPKLAYQVFFGPCTAYQYRLMGPGAWKGARDAILMTSYRMDYSLNPRNSTSKEEKSSALVYALAMAVLAFFLYIAFSKF